jgi:hypothetical protein
MCKLLHIQLRGGEDVRYYVEWGGWYVWYRRILNWADERGILPELLVDEEYYYSKSGMAPYRAAFAIGRKWATIDEFYEHLIKDHAFAPGKVTMYDLLRGRLYHIRDARLWVVLKLCRMAEIPMAYLFTPYRRLGANTPFGMLTYLVSALSDVDVATLVGFAKLLLGGEVKEQDVQRLLAWRNEQNDRKASQSNAG